MEIGGKIVLVVLALVIADICYCLWLGAKEQSRAASMAISVSGVGLIVCFLATVAFSHAPHEALLQMWTVLLCGVLLASVTGIFFYLRDQSLRDCRSLRY